MRCYNHPDMAQDKVNSKQTKISSEFTARLERLRPSQKVRAVVMLRTPAGSASAGRRQTAGQRRKALTSVRKSAAAALPEIDRILEEFRGERLTEDIGALGTISVQATSAAINALAASPHVRVILEDQPVAALVNSR